MMTSGRMAGMIAHSVLDLRESWLQTAWQATATIADLRAAVTVSAAVSAAAAPEGGEVLYSGEEIGDCYSMDRKVVAVGMVAVAAAVAAAVVAAAVG